jgi:hypothetical protein
MGLKNPGISGKSQKKPQRWKNVQKWKKIREKFKNKKSKKSLKIPRFLIWDFWEKNPKNLWILDMGFGIQEKSHPKATSASESQK